MRITAHPHGSLPPVPIYETEEEEQEHGEMLGHILSILNQMCALNVPSEAIRDFYRHKDDYYLLR